MIPFFLFTGPRSGGTSLQRMLDLTPGVRCGAESFDWLERLRGLTVPEDEPGAEWGRVERQSEKCEVIREKWQGREMLRDKIAVPLHCGYYGIRSSFCARDTWDEAVGFYSWVLATWPEARVIFLARKDEEALEYSLEVTWPLWIPKYGTCNGNVLMRARDQRQWMLDFAEMNPGRCTVIDTEDLADYEGLRWKLERAGLPLSRMAWEAMDTERPGARTRIRGAIELLATRREDDPAADWVDGMPLPELNFDNEVGKKLEKAIEEQLERIEGRGRWEQKEIEGAIRPEYPKEKAATEGVMVYTLRYGREPWMAECGGSLKAWTERHGLELRVWRETDPSYPHPKFAEVDMLRDFLKSEARRMIYVYADVFVHPTAPMMEDHDGMAIMIDLPFRGAEHLVWGTWCRNHFPGLETEGWQYRNAGVWSIDRLAAEQLLAVIEKPYHEGVMEQHHFNVWLMAAAAKGMVIHDLREAWNTFAGQNKAAWFHHLAGRGCKLKKLNRLRDLSLLPQKPEEFEERAATAGRAVCYLYKAAEARGEELRYSLRSVWEHLVDCPEIHIFGDERPEWLVDGKGVHFHLKPGYPEALAAALQQADEVLLMNDDIYYLRRSTWEDHRTARTRGRNLIKRMARNLANRSRWLRSVGRATASLHHHGVDYVRDFSTHTPYLFEREKSLATLRRHGVWRKVPFETLYHNDHGTPHRRCGVEKAMKVPADAAARWFNHGAGGADPQSEEELKAMLTESAPWELKEDFEPSRRGYQGWFDYQDIYRRIVDEAPEGATIVEVGVWEGGSLGYLAEYAAHRRKKLRIIGYDAFHVANELGSPRNLRSDAWEAMVRENLSQTGMEVELVRSDSAEAAGRHEDGSVFAVWIDADHSKLAVKRDVLAWLPKVARGGIFAGHDLNIREVKEGIDAAGIEVEPVSRRSWMMTRPTRSRTLTVFLAVGGKLPHLEEFKRWNPHAETQVIELPKLEGEALRVAWRHGDRPLLEWWETKGRFTDAERVVFVEWDVKFSAAVDDVFPRGADFLGPDVHELGDGWMWWDELERLPAGLRKHAMGIAPLSVLMFSRRCLEAMRLHPLKEEAMAADAFCEMRIATLATAAGYAPRECRGLKNVQLVNRDPGSAAGVWHPVKV